MQCCYVAENFGSPFRLPELGPLGANGLAHRRHFLTPLPLLKNQEGSFELIGKFNGQLSVCRNGTFSSGCRRMAWQLCAFQIRSS